MHSAAHRDGPARGIAQGGGGLLALVDELRCQQPPALAVVVDVDYVQ